MGGILRLQVGIGGKSSNYAYSLRVEGILSLQVGVGSLSLLTSRGNIPPRKEVSLSDFLVIVITSTHIDHMPPTYEGFIGHSLSSHAHHSQKFFFLVLFSSCIHVCKLLVVQVMVQDSFFFGLLTPGQDSN